MAPPSSAAHLIDLAVDFRHLPDLSKIYIAKIFTNPENPK